MNKKSFAFLLLAIIFFVAVLFYYFFYITKTGGKDTLNNVVKSNSTEKTKPTVRELEKAAEEVRDTTPITPERTKELEKAANEVSALPNTANLKSVADQMAAFDKEREKNRADLLRAAEGVNN